MEPNSRPVQFVVPCWKGEKPDEAATRELCHDLVVEQAKVLLAFRSQHHPSSFVCLVAHSDP